MAKMLEGKTVVVFGANGQVGRPLVKRLVDEGAVVIAMCKNERQVMYFEDWMKEVNLGGLQAAALPCNIIDESPNSMTCLLSLGLDFMGRGHEIHGMVYAVNHYPAGGGVTEASRDPLTQKMARDLQLELNLHVTGLHRAVSAALPYSANGARFVVVSSAVTEITDAQCPPFLHAGLYSAAKAAQDELVKWWRRDETIKKKNIRLQLLKPSAIDTPSHDGPFGAPKDKRIPMPVFLDEVLAALMSQEIITKVIRTIGG
jgi:NAD(P)-dependent dehydrogenase (short-subunit alcohol dehydrogenase family)